MACINNDPNGRKRILFVAPDGSRKTIRLGKASKKQAEAVKVKVENLVSAGLQGTGVLDDEVSRWLAALDDKMHGRLAAAGLVKPRSRTGVTLKAFLDEFFAAIVVKPTTATTYRQTRRVLIDYFGELKLLREIEPVDAEKWRQEMVAKGLAGSTISRRVKCARQMFKRAVKWKIIRENPFTDVVAGAQTNKTRQFFITREMAEKVLEACPDAQWRLLFALSRYGGLRCPSEHLALKWSDIDWGNKRIRVPSCKTEHIEGKDCRIIPLFPELQKPLLDVYAEYLDSPEASEYVITRYRDPAANLRTRLLRIIGRANLTPWPKVWHNLRSSRQTELAEEYPIHVVCAWLGNTRAVAQEHYLQLTDAHFTQAAQEQPSTTSPDPTEKAAQKEAQYPAGQCGTEQNDAAADKQNRPDLPGDSTPYDSVLYAGMTPTGFEPVLSA